MLEKGLLLFPSVGFIPRCLRRNKKINPYQCLVGLPRGSLLYTVKTQKILKEFGNGKSVKQISCEQGVNSVYKTTNDFVCSLVIRAGFSLLYKQYRLHFDPLEVFVE